KLVEIQEHDGFKLEATFGKDRPTLISKIKAKFDEINGVDKQEAPEKITVKKVGESDERTDQKVADTVEYVDEQDTKYDKKATDYTNQETERTLQEAVTEAVRQDELVRQDAMAAAQKAEENAISKSVAKEIYNAQVDEILKSLDDVDGVVTKQNERIGEVSNKVTDFEVKIDKYDGKFVSYDETINELEGKVTTSIEKVEGFGNKVEANTTEIAKQAGMIAAKLDETTYTKDKDGMVKDIASNKAEIEATAKEVSSKVSRDEFDSLEIGGRNYIQNGLPANSDLWIFTEQNKSGSSQIKDGYLSITNDNNGWKQWQLYSHKGAGALDKLEADTDYTISFEVRRSENAAGRIAFHLRYSVDGGTSDQITISKNVNELGTDWTRLSNTGKISSEILKDYKYVRVIAYYSGNGTVDFRKMNLVQGNKAPRDWTPAPEDVDSRIDHAETEIKQNADEILLRATKDEVDKERTKINKAQADITANADAIKLRATTTQLNTEKKRITNAEGRIDVLDNAVKLKASQEDVDGLEGRVTKAEGELKVLPGEISAKVSKDGLIGEINAQPDNLLIDFARVKMTGALEAKHIKSLSGLNVNDQFIVSPSGNVTFGGDMVGGNIKGSTLTSDVVLGNTRSSTVIRNDYVKISSQDNRTTEFINRIEMYAGNLR